MTEGRRRDRLNLVLILLVAALAAGFLIGFGGRPGVILSNASLDDALFTRLGRSLASGHWLGPYDQDTLVKGIGFPVFLAMSNFVGLPFPLSLALFHIVSAGLASVVLWRVLNSRLAAAGLFALLMLAPVFYEGDLLRVIRDFFYMSLTLAFMASAVALVSGRFKHRRALAVLTGLLGGWWWLTREEGVWLVPSLFILALLPMLRRSAPDPATDTARGLRSGAYPALAGSLLLGIAVVLGVAAMNRAVYGRFVVNEIKDRSFAGALQALQRVGGAYPRNRTPVPRPARAEIYRVSPTFATLRTPIFDGPQSVRYTAVGCAADPQVCGDFGGGWFLWDLREAAALRGVHASPAKAAAFYEQIAREVNQACDGGQLRCVTWPIPLAPPLRPGQMGDVAASARKVAGVMAFSLPIWTAALDSDRTAPDAQAMYGFLNHPDFAPPTVRRRFAGWFVEQGPRWFGVRPTAGVEIVAFDRRDSPDLVAHFHDGALGRQRFGLEVKCPAFRSCPVSLALEDGTAFPVDLASLPVGARPLGPATMFLDLANAETPEVLLKTRLSKRWVAAAASLNRLYQGLLALGGLAFLAMAARAVLARTLSLPLVLAAALLAAVLTRIVILALIDALSFPVANVVYALPAIPLLLMFCVIALHDAATGFRPGRPRA